MSDFNKIKSLNSAVLFLVYNRPQNTKKVFKSLSQVKPTRLYIACDGPKKGRAEDMRRVSEVRDIVNLVDWNCEVKTLFQDTNLGCKLAVELAITWFFDHEEFGIILEDDCLPNKDFYYFCENLLLKYRNDDRVYAITGDNFQQGTVFGNASYYFSKYVHVWGWATWRRAWKHYDKDLSFWPSWKKSSEWEVLFTDKKEKKYWYKIFESVFNNKIDTWDFYWVGCVWKQNGLTATPNLNLVSNIGFGRDSTHTSFKKSSLANMPTFELDQIVHPFEIIRNEEADRNAFNFVFNSRSLPWPLASFFKIFVSVVKLFRGLV